MAKYHKITFERVSQCLWQDPETGKIYWKYRDKSQFNTLRGYSVFNAIYAGKEAFICVGNHGYKEGAIDGCGVLAHRVAWMLSKGKWPDCDIDHINGDKLDNRIENLRDVSVSVNQQNALGKSNNTSGFNGVQWDKNRNKWIARMMVNYKNIYLGRYDNFEDAVKARTRAEAYYQFTSRHGDLSWKEKIDSTMQTGDY